MEEVSPLIGTRTLKIEEDGDYWRKTIKPKIRLKGNWLERAGFKPGERVRVKCLATGIIELRSPQAANVESIQPIPSEGGES